MKELVRLSLLILCCGIAYNSNAQQSGADTNKAVKLAPAPVPKPPVAKKPKPIRTETSGGFRFMTNGWGFFLDKGWVQSEEKQRDYFYDVKLFQVEFEEKKNPKEIKRTKNLGGTGGENNAKPFIYGKANNFYAFKMGYGKRRMIAGKPEHGAVSIHWVYLGGLSAGLLKPYYYEAVFSPTPDFVQYEIKKVKYNDTVEGMPFRQFIGGAGFGKGLNEIKLVPGIHAKTALHFDFAASKTKKLAVETGINAELYMKNIELMAVGKSVPYIVNLYASFQFGGRRQ
jgi:hypothetical protein